MPRLPFAMWLDELRIKYGTSKAASMTGLDERQIRTIINGYFMAKGQTWASDHVDIDTVDRALIKSGGTTTLNDLYPLD